MAKGRQFYISWGVRTYPWSTRLGFTVPVWGQCCYMLLRLGYWQESWRDFWWGVVIECWDTWLRWDGKVECQMRRSRRDAHGVEDLEDRLRRARLKWFGHVRRREKGQILRRTVELKVMGKRLAGRLRKAWRQGVEEDLRCLNIREDIVDDRQQWRWLISCLTPAVRQDGC